MGIKLRKFINRKSPDWKKGRHFAIRGEVRQGLLEAAERGPLLGSWHKEEGCNSEEKSPRRGCRGNGFPDFYHIPQTAAVERMQASAGRQGWGGGGGTNGFLFRSTKAKG